jgi:hypothetical protein
VVGAGQEDPLDAVDGGAQRGGVAEVADRRTSRIAFSGSRTNARTGVCRRRSSRTTCAPTVPVAPVTRTGFIENLPV